MRFKYKKLVLVFTIAIMFIGLGTFSLIAPSIDFTAGSKADEVASGGGGSAAVKNVVADMSDSEVKSAISGLISGYFDAKQRVDLDKIAGYVSDISRVDNKRLVAEAEYIEEYRNKIGRAHV